MPSAGTSCLKGILKEGDTWDLRIKIFTVLMSSVRMMALQARLGPPLPEQTDKCLLRAGLACLGQGWSVLRGARGGSDSLSGHQERTPLVRKKGDQPCFWNSLCISQGPAATRGGRWAEPAVRGKALTPTPVAAGTQAPREFRQPCPHGAEPGTGAPRAGPCPGTWAQTWEPAH